MTLPETPVASSPQAAAAAPAPAPASAYPPTPKVIEIMVKVSDKVSDLIFSPHRPPQVELNGALVPVAGLPVLTVADTTRIAGDLLAGNKRSIEVLKSEGSADVSYSAPRRPFPREHLPPARHVCHRDARHPAQHSKPAG